MSDDLWGELLSGGRTGGPGELPPIAAAIRTIHIETGTLAWASVHLTGEPDPGASVASTALQYGCSKGFRRPFVMLLRGMIESIEADMRLDPSPPPPHTQS